MNIRIGRNDPCVCGSGRKYKKCCLLENERKSRLLGKELLIIDQTPIQKEALKKLRNVLAEQERLQNSLKEFQKKILPEFEKEYSNLFGEKLTEIREVSSELQNLQRLAMEINAECEMGNCSQPEAYRRVMKYWDNPEERERIFKKRAEYFSRLEMEDMEDDENFSFFDDDEDDFDDSPMNDGGIFDTAFESMFKEFGSEMGSDEKDNFRRFMMNELGFSSKPENRESKIKEVYKEIVKQLHPDRNSDLSEELRQLWYEVQDAHDNNDLERLETYSALLEFLKFGQLKGKDALIILQKSGKSISDLYKSIHFLKSSLKGLRSQMNKARKTSAWKFFKNPEKRKEIISTEKEKLFLHLQQLESEKNDLAYALNALKKAAERTGKRHLPHRGRGKDIHSPLRHP